MPTTAQSILRRVVDTLGDTTSIKWTIDRLVRYLNDGQRAILTLRPDALNTSTVLELVSGHKQSLPPNGEKLITVLANANGNRRAVSETSLKVLDASVPNWRSMDPTQEILHYMYDPREPRRFDVYPPADDGAALDIEYAALPVDIVEPAPGQLYTAVTGNISVGDLFATPLGEYVLYRCHAEFSEEAQIQRAQAHLGAFTQLLGAEAQATAAVVQS
jgi:hypothetical protein